MASYEKAMAKFPCTGCANATSMGQLLVYVEPACPNGRLILGAFVAERSDCWKCHEKVKKKIKSAAVKENNTEEAIRTAVGTC